MKTIIGIVGMPGAGKSTAIEIGKEFAPIIVMGDIVREETLARRLEITSQNLGHIAQTLREEEGTDIIAQRCMGKIQNMENHTIIVDGLRSLHEVKLFRADFSVKIVAITAENALRQTWLLNRGRLDDSARIKDIEERDQREINFGICDVIDNADYTIQNSGTIEELKKKCKALFQEVIL